MKYNSSRRNFLRNTTLASMGVALFSVSAFSANTENGKEIFKIGTDGEYPDLRSSRFSIKHIIIEGVVYDKSGIIPRHDATIEVWQYVRDSQRKINSAKLRVNGQGKFAFKADFPVKEEGKTGRIYFKVSTNQNDYTTELIVNDFGAYFSEKHWERNKQLGDKLFPQKQTFASHSTIKFNLSI